MDTRNSVNYVYFVFVCILFLCNVKKSCCDTIYGEDDTMHPVFIFGPMKRGEPMHHWLENPENGVAFFITKARTAQRFPMVIATEYNVPLVLFKPESGHNIQGELYELSLKMIKKLDRYEFMPNEVIPRIEMITYNDTKKNQTILRPAMMYVKYYLLDDSYLKLPFISNYQSRGDHGLEFRERPPKEKRKGVKKKKRLKYGFKKVERRNITYVSEAGNYTYEVEDLSGDIRRMQRRLERSQRKKDRENLYTSKRPTFTNNFLKGLNGTKLN
ncbi:gamma-glutamylaminecyclotransferase C-like [Macrosteles quadrilineatus]|uniref:gamma-glutamylaminecyclotransferase C-like n=1 Tax=Macrosteles quadrilineatus TaxID=74068 RepID=UPI0023E34B4B|nr:gamma-glutamylaminecyclotransferase C-like [Macrosteles quadrilineatus]